MDMLKKDAYFFLHKNRRGTAVFTHGYSIAQCTDFPKHIIDYIIQNPKSLKQWKKLIQTCKLFFDKNPILAIPCLHFCGYIYVGDKTIWNTCFPGPCKKVAFGTRCIEIFNAPFKLWITENLFLNDATNAKKLIPQIFRCDVKKLVLRKQLSFDEFLFLSSNAVDLCLGAKVIDENGKPFVLEQIVESLLPASLEIFEYYNHEDDITINTFKKLSKMENVQKLRKIKFNLRFFTFIDVDDLFKFIVENKQICFELDISYHHGTEEDIQKIKNAAIKMKGEGYQLPRICIDNIAFGD